jgi:hypothetical protein
MKVWWNHNNERGQQSVTLESEVPEDIPIIEFLGHAGDVTDQRQTLRMVRQILGTHEGESVIEQARHVMYELGQQTKKPA